MAGIETIWELHTLPVINSWYYLRGSFGMQTIILNQLTTPELRVAIYKQLNAVPYLGGVYGISLGHYYGKRPCQLYVVLVNHIYGEIILHAFA